MIDLQTLKEESERWHSQHAFWVSEAQKWQKESHRLSALLHLLDKALPEHSALLNKHIALIEKHEEMVTCYECGLEPKCLKSCETYKTEQEHEELHQSLCQLHTEVEQEHEKLKQTLVSEMAGFRKLAKELLQRAVID